MFKNSISLFLAISLMASSIKVFARSIDGETETANENQSLIKLPAIVCIVGVVAIVATGGFCLFSSRKKRKTPSEKYLNTKNSNTSLSSSPNTTNSELLQLNRETEEVDITVKVESINNKPESEKIEEEEEKEKEPKRRSIFDSILNRNPKKEHRKSNIQFMEDRSLNSISTNEDWINEQKLQADLRQENDELYDDDNADVNSNDGFWNSDLQPIQSSSDNQQKSYAVPSLGKRNSVIIKGSEQKTKRQSVIIVNDNEELTETVDELEKSEKSVELKPNRVKSWKNNEELDKELKELLKNIEDEEENIKKTNN
ncbi:hypothetical protein BCR36DRAFT_291791 [Piromyces finnis]|uniref:Transmembrane protein n=1 Tax=Piromyces finnis TaxID=1754191 RepID=A0A1Y1V8T4_9FUNG|nr:hypothetical protein BCR36DRAFT_291791 [Piromyces finnis]|eukprot:ORX49283.1 hypothetical protein BCR36DRAFT_291791 [Piromyces finnis]